MDTDQLEAFARVVRDGSFTGAARSLGIGQPAVSARILALETAVGGPVFTRGRHVRLTPLGESFLPYASRALAVLAEGKEVGRMVREGERGRITFGTLGSLAGGLVGPAVAKVSAAHPRVEWTIKSGDHERVLEHLFDGVIDLALVTWPISHALESDLAVLARFREPVPLVAHPDHPLAKLARPTTRDLVRHARLFLSLRWWVKIHPVVLGLAERCGTAMEVPMETARGLALDGAAVAFFTQTYVAQDLAAGRLVPIALSDSPRLVRDSALLRRAGAAPLSRPANALVSALREQAKRLGLRLP